MSKIRNIKKKSLKALQEAKTLPPSGYNNTECNKELEKIRKELFELQNIFYADSRHSLLIILQGMDAAGKDSTIRHVFTSMNPMGVNVKSFVKPTTEELKHDFLWRIYPHFPGKGMIEIFNRSHYEDILVPMANKTLDRDILDKRCKLINMVEQNLSEDNTIILKFFLNISYIEQRKRIAERESKAEKRWKFSINDRHSENKWNEYLNAYSYIFENCNTLPWHIVPADKKWYRNFLIGKTLIRELKKLNLRYPDNSGE